MSFNNIIGQDRAIAALRAEMKNSHLAQSYLFTGPEGVGKNLTAKAFAQAVNCQEEGLDSCGRCASCLKIEKDIHPDLHLIDAEDSEIKIEYIRNLQSEIALRPYEAKFKVFMVRNAHNLNIASSNAFLKTLEEPARQSLIILITEKPTLLLKTIISRCRVLKFYPLERKALKEVLLKDYSLQEPLAHFLAYFCEGRLGEALRLKDLNMLEEKNRVIDDFSLSAAGLGSLAAERPGLRNYLNILAAWIRDIYLIKSGLPHSELINLDREQDLLRLAPQFSFLDLEQRLNFISGALGYLEHNINVKLLQANLRFELCKG